VVEHSLLLGQLRAHEDEVISMAISASGTVRLRSPFDPCSE
jgi:hypothetical protein